MQQFIEAYRYTTSGIYESIQDMFRQNDLKIIEVYVPSHHLGFNKLNEKEFNVFRLYKPRTMGPLQKIIFDKDIADELNDIVNLETLAKKRKKVIEAEAEMYL